MQTRINNFKKQVENQNKEIRKLKMENKELLKQKEAYKKKYMEKDSEFEIVKNLNRDLQTAVIEKSKEYNRMYYTFKFIKIISSYI